MSRLLWIAPCLLLVLGLLLLGRGVPEERGAPAGTEQAAPPRRMVSLAPSLTDLVVALGASERLVAVTDFCEGVEGNVARLGGLSFDVERILALVPDRVLAIETAQQTQLLALLEDEGIAVDTFPAESVADLLRSIEGLGRILARESAAGVLVAKIEDALVPPPDAAGEEDPLPALFVVQRDPLLVAGGGSFVTTMMSAAGLRNVFADDPSHYPRQEMETVIAHDPVLILDASFGGGDPFAFWGRFDALRAVRENGVVAFPPVRPGPRIPEWVAAMRAEVLERRP